MRLKKAAFVIFTSAILTLNYEKCYPQEGLEVTPKAPIEKRVAPQIIELNQTNLERAHLYERAAEKRRTAANAQVKRAEELLNEAEDKKAVYTHEDKQKKRSYYLAGTLELKAGELQILASKNYEFSANNLDWAIRIYKNLPKDKDYKLEKLIEQQKDDASNTTIYYTHAIDAYLTAADSFSELKAGDLEKEAEANIKAAMQLEDKADKK